MWHKAGIAGLALLGALNMGCSPTEYSLSELDSQRPGYSTLNGTEQNGIRLNGIRLNGIRLNGIDLGGTSMHVSDISSGNLTVTTDDFSGTKTSTQLVGAKVTANLTDGTTSQFRIDSISYSSDFGGNLYTVSAYDGSNWVPACGYDPTGYYSPPNVPIPSVVLFGNWDLNTGNYIPDPTQFTFGCTNAAIGKCVTWGYIPWQTKSECLSGGTCHNVDLSIIHQACTRLVRADYCGNGVYHTVTGTGLDVYDALNIQARDGVSGYSLEAEWRPDGAHCIHHTRWTKADLTQDTAYATDLAYVTATCPSRLASNDSTCADPNVSHYYKQYGYGDSISSRSVLREETYVH